MENQNASSERESPENREPSHVGLSALLGGIAAMRKEQCWQCSGKGHLVITLTNGEATVTCDRCSGHGYLVDDSPETQAALGDVDWLLIGSTDEYAELKRDIAIVCRDVVGFIDEICIHDIVATFRKHGFEVVRQ